jgi:hypothetical protein
MDMQVSPMKFGAAAQCSKGIRVHNVSFKGLVQMNQRRA